MTNCLASFKNELGVIWLTEIDSIEEEITDSFGCQDTTRSKKNLHKNTRKKGFLSEEDTN